MENLLLLAVAGALMPTVVSFLKKSTWPSKVKLALSVGSTVVVTAGVMAIQGNYHSFHDLATNAAVIWATSQVVYHLYFDGTPMEEWLTRHGIN